MDAHALKALEYEKVLDRLAGHAATSMGQILALQLTPAASLAEAERRQSETDEARRLIDENGSIPLGGAHNLIPFLEKALLAGSLNGKEILDVGETLAASERLRKFLLKKADVAPHLAIIAQNLIALPDLAKAITSALDDTGEVKDSASERLARTRRDLRTASGRIQDKLNGIIQSAALRTALQDPVVVTRHGRWCVPVRSDHKSSVPGIVHDASASGATLFVEPQAVVELGNKLRELEAAETEEVDRILRELTGKVAAKADELRVTTFALADIDLAAAKARMAEALNASRPKLSHAAYVNFFQARHPLLKEPVTPIDVRVGSDFKGLLITGPNTGGKTVTLKTVGLLVLMALAGMQIPAAPGSECGIFSDIFADIGDEQSIEQSLSTFSGHVRNIVHTITRIKPGSLVLFDELGAGTDPAEGAALASAVLKWLAHQGACIIATTHYGELKAFAFLSDGFENASVEFDKDTLKPTYRLMIGVPGASQALHIAERLGMPKAVLEEARKALGSASTAADELIRRVEQSRLKAMKEEDLAEQARREAEGLKGRYQQDLSRLSQARAQVKEQVQSEALKIIRETQAELEDVLRRLRTQKRHSQTTEGLAAKAKRLTRKIETASTSMERSLKAVKEEPATAPEEAGPAPNRPMRKGDRVRMAGMSVVGTLVSVPTRDEAVVMFGSMEARVPPNALELVGEAPRPARIPGSPSIDAEVSKASVVSPEIMLRGERIDEAIARLDRYLDDACLAGLERVRIIHGKGTGVLRRAVQEFMRKHPSVASTEAADAAEGGEGATIARLK